jgi:hypothetical protein
MEITILVRPQPSYPTMKPEVHPLNRERMLLAKCCYCTFYCPGYIFPNTLSTILRKCYLPTMGTKVIASA